MSWARFDDQYSDNPKILEAGPWAELLDMRAIIYCARMSTDGLITRPTLKRIGHGIPKLTERVHTLVEVGRWTVNETGGGWFVHDFLLFNPSKAQKDAERERGRERVKKHRLSTDGNAVTPANGLRDGMSSMPEEFRGPTKFIERCARCGKIEFDCYCPKLVADDGTG